MSLDRKTIFHIGMSVYISNVGILSTVNQLNTSQTFILGRYNIINSILVQLLYDSSEIKERNVIIADDLQSQKEFQYTKYRNNFSSKHVFLREQLEISTIMKSEKIWLKKEDLRKQKKKMEEVQEKFSMLSAPNPLLVKKSQVYQRTFYWKCKL